jgi:hypothetical protein
MLAKCLISCIALAWTRSWSENLLWRRLMLPSPFLWRCKAHTPHPGMDGLATNSFQDNIDKICCSHTHSLRHSKLC